MKRPIVLPSLIAVAGALLLVFHWHWGRMLWLDEEMIAINIRERALPQLAGRLSLGQAAPYGWLALERAMFLGFGDGERALRFVPLAFGIALLAVAAWVGYRWLTVAGAATLTFLCAAGQWVWFHALELKHYSADTCFGLLLPALAVRAIEQHDALTWWLAAAVAQWFSNGALFVAPVCAIVIAACAFRRDGFRGSARATAPALVWILSFAINYAVNLGPVRTNEFLRDYWSNAFPPAGATAGAALHWVGSQLAPLALKPGGSGFGLLFWLVAATGFAASPIASRAFRCVFGLVPLSALLLAGLRLVPMFERLSLWIVPALYVGIALSADAVIGAFRSGPDRQASTRALAAAAAVVLLLLIADVGQRGTTYLSFAEPVANHEVDDRAAIRWLARQRLPGDMWVTTRNALPAVWWYANGSGPAFDAIVDPDPNACGTNELGAVLHNAGAVRALVYLGFGHRSPPAFDETLIARLGALGRVVAYNRYGENGHAMVVDLQAPPSGPLTLASLGAVDEPASPAAAGGCIAIAAANRW